MKANELPDTGLFKGLIYGDSGTGKTVLAASFPGPIEYWDFDHKISSATRFYRDKPEMLSQIEVTQFANLERKDRIPAFEKRNRALGEYRKANDGKLPFKTLVLDSLTTFHSMIMDDYIIRSQLGIKRGHPELNALQDYQLIDKQLTLIISGLLALPCHVVMIGHIHTDKDETTGALSRQLLMAGKFASKLPIYFEEIYVSKVTAEGKFILQTRSDAMHKCRSQRQLAKEIPSLVSEILK